MKTKFRAVGVGIGSEGTREFILGKEEISCYFLQSLTPTSHCLIGIKVCRVVFDRISSKLIN